MFVECILVIGVTNQILTCYLDKIGQECMVYMPRLASEWNDILQNLP